MHTSERTLRWYGSLYRPDRLFMRRDLMRRVRNSAWRSEDFANAVWGKVNVTVSSNHSGTLAPDGHQTADLMEKSGGSAVHQVDQFVDGGQVGGNATAGAPLTLSVFAKKRDLDWLHLDVWDVTNDLMIQWFNLATGTLGTTARLATAIGTEIQILDAGMDPYPHGWWRCWVVARIGSDTNVGIDIGLSGTDGVEVHSNEGGIWIWGAQIENNKDFVGPYVRTLASASVEEGVDFNGTPKLLLADGANSGSTGVKLSYTVPLDRRARVKSATMVLVSGTPTVQLRITRGGTVPVIAVFTATGAVAHELSLEAGDILEWNVSASSTGSIDLTMSIEELQ